VVSASANPGQTVLGKTVLVVEDEDSIRLLVQYALESRGYTVLCAGDGTQALKLDKDHPGPIDILVTDLIMPGLSGTELVEKIQASRPDLKILFITGNAESLPVDNPAMRLLAKPFSPSQLLDALQAIST
jgi:CheY-like chemotaxis protein